MVSEVRQEQVPSIPELKGKVLRSPTPPNKVAAIAALQIANTMGKPSGDFLTPLRKEGPDGRFAAAEGPCLRDREQVSDVD